MSGQGHLDTATIYLWQREDVGTIGEQGNHIAHVTWELATSYWLRQTGLPRASREFLERSGIPTILTLSAWDMTALFKVARKLEDNKIPHKAWEDPDHTDKGIIALSTEPLEPLPIFKELFGNYKLWPTVNVPQLLDKHLPKTVHVDAVATARDHMGGHTVPEPADEDLVPYISAPRARAAVMEILKDLHMVRR